MEFNNELDFELDDRLLTGYKKDEDRSFDSGLRPQQLKEYIGQSKAKEKLEIFLKASKMREESLDHVLLYGPPGLGKTTLASIIAKEMNANIRVTSGPAIERPGDLAAVLTNLKQGDVLFIDEIHRLNRAVEEILYPAMEDYVIDIMIGKGQGAKSIRLDLMPFTLIGATTRAGLLTSPLRDRFGIINKLELYSMEELTKIVIRSSGILNIEIDQKGAEEIASRSRGTPRIANRLLKRVRDYAEVKENGEITEVVAVKALKMLEIDELGLDKVDQKIIEVIIKNFGGGPVGIDTLAASTGEEKNTIEDVYEPFLLQQGFLNRTPRGRVASPRAYDHFGFKRPDGMQESLL